jgi:hypothetical protein
MSDGDGLMFCFFTVNSSTALLITSGLLALSLALIGDAFRKYWRIGSLNNRSVTFVYRMIFAWWTSTPVPIKPTSPPISSASSYSRSTTATPRPTAAAT